MATPVQKIYDKFQMLITDFEILDYSNEDQKRMLFSWLDFSCGEFYMCIKVDSLNETLQQFDDDLDREEINILAYGMIPSWLSPKLLHEDNIKQRLGDKDYKTYSPANMLEKLINLKNDTLNELATRMASYPLRHRTRGVINDAE